PPTCRCAIASSLLTTHNSRRWRRQTRSTLVAPKLSFSRALHLDSCFDVPHPSSLSDCVCAMSKIETRSPSSHAGAKPLFRSGIYLRDTESLVAFRGESWVVGIAHAKVFAQKCVRPRLIENQERGEFTQRATALRRATVPTGCDEEVLVELID